MSPSVKASKSTFLFDRRKRTSPGNLSRVKITDEVIDYAGKKHWHGINLSTGRKVYIRGAGRLRRVAQSKSASHLEPEMYPAGSTIPGAVMPLG